MFFGGTDEEARKISGLVFPHPALIFKLLGKDLFVRLSWGLYQSGNRGNLSAQD
jgi:hypothetical protein